MTYNDSYAVTLPLRDWLAVQCALYDAISRNKEQGYPALADDYKRLLDRVIDNATRAALEQAAATLRTTRAVIVEVSGGVAEVTQCPENVDVKIIDHDNEAEDA